MRVSICLQRLRASWQFGSETPTKKNKTKNGPVRLRIPIPSWKWVCSDSVLAFSRTELPVVATVYLRFCKPYQRTTSDLYHSEGLNLSRLMNLMAVQVISPVDTKLIRFTNKYIILIIRYHSDPWMINGMLLPFNWCPSTGHVPDFQICLGLAPLE